MIQSLARALELLDALKKPDEEFTIAYLSERLQLPPSTVHRILQTLCEYRFVVKDERAHTYKLGPALIPLGTVVRHNLKLQYPVTPTLKSLSSTINEDSYFIVPMGYKGLILERSESDNMLNVVDRFGYERYLHSGANRKAILSHLPKAFIDDYIQNALPLADALPKTTAEKLLPQLEQAKAEGVAVSYGEYITGTIGIGSPVFDYEGKVKGSIGVIIPEYRVKNELHLDELKQIIKKHAYDLSISMGYSPSLSPLT